MVIRWSLLSIFFLLLANLNIAGEEQSEDISITFSGNNTFEALSGKKEVRDIDFFNTGDYLVKPWYYFQDLLDFDFGVQDFSFRGRFKVNEPSKGFYPLNSYVYEEFFEKRTLSYNGKYLRVDAGTFQAAFGRGLTFQNGELPTIERSSLLDGVFGISNMPLLKLQGFIGRDAKKKMGAINSENSSLVLDNQKYRNTIYGIHGESYPFSHIPGLSFLSASSVGGGMVTYRTKVAEIKDSLVDSNIVYYQPRIQTSLPSGFLNLSVGNLSTYIEHSRLVTSRYYYDDSLKAENSKKYLGYGTYLSTGLQLWKFYLLGEYGNYYYGRDKNSDGYDAIKEYVNPSLVRLKPDWQLLEKKSGSVKVDDFIGYNMELEWKALKTTSFIFNYNTGGKRVEEGSLFAFSGSERYWEFYTQWDQAFGEKLNLRVGVDYGSRDIEISDKLYSTIGTVLDIGPINNKHLFTVKGEFQNIMEPYYSVKDMSSLKTILKPYLIQAGLTETTADSIINNSSKQTLKKYFSEQVPVKEKREETKQNILNYLMRFTYSLSPYFSVTFHFEQEMKFLEDWYASDKRKMVILTEDIVSKTRFYEYVIISVKPVDRIKLTFEGGTFGQRCQCSPAGCSIIPAFKGVKFFTTYMF